SGDVLRYENVDGRFLSPTTEAREYVPPKCVPAQFENGVPVKADLKGVSGVCFSTGAPHFDETRCNFFGLDGQEGALGWNPKDNIIESIRCGAITDTYSHSKNLLKIQEQIYMCLEQAKI